MDFDVFNGDADGICALVQLRLAEPRNAVLVTGVKRDIARLERVRGGVADRVAVLDVSMEKNRAPLDGLLAAGAEVLYIDHHFAGEIPVARGLTALINEAPRSAPACWSTDTSRAVSRAGRSLEPSGITSIGVRGRLLANSR